MAKDAASATQAWEQGLSGARQKYIDGVNAVTTAPGAAAAAQVGVWAANTSAAQAKFARNVAKVSLGQWQQAAAAKGADRLASGAAAGAAKMGAFLQKFIPYIQQQKASLPKRGTYEQNKARMIAMVDAAHKFQNS
jgi:hypothetical protein